MWTLLLLFLCSLSGCEEESVYIKYIDHIVVDYTRYLQAKEPTLRILDIGGRYISDVEQIDVSYEIKKNMNFVESRRFYVMHSQRFLETINSDKKIRPYLRNYPATIENIELSFKFIGSDNECVNSPHIAQISVSNGKLFYSIYNQEADQLETFYVEPYEEAVRMIKGVSGSRTIIYSMIEN